MHATLAQELATRAAARYRAAGRFAWKWAEGKLYGDPVFMGIRQHRLIRDGETVLDLGCGQGLLAAWLQACHEYANGNSEHPANDSGELCFRGIELSATDVRRAHAALGDSADIRCGNIRTADFGKADVAVILDVLHYIDYASQADVLRRVHAALRPGGRLLLRIGDAQAGWRFRWSNWVDKLVVLARYRRWTELWCRSMPEWQELLARTGFSVQQLPMSEGTGFANVLLVAEKR